MRKTMTVVLVLIGLQSAAQDTTGALTISGYAEAYYLYDFNKPGDNNRPSFVYSHNRHNEFNLNLGYIKVAYTAQRVRANLAIAAGTYMNSNYAAEPGVLKNVYEANTGIRISRKKNLWLDAGIFSSHIGFEGAVSKDCWTLTRSMLADNSPYFEAGAKLTYTSDNGKWLLSGLALNGWQRITRVSGNSKMSWGTQVQFRPAASVLLNYSTFIGTDKPDSARLNRVFHNIYGSINITNRLAITAGCDLGLEEKLPGSRNWNTWYAPVLIGKYSFNKQWTMAVRWEHYADKKGVIIASPAVNGFRVSGYSLNLDYTPVAHIMARVECRGLKAKDPQFVKGNTLTESNFFITSSIAVSF